MHKKLSTVLFYCAASTLIVGWWYVAFQKPFSSTTSTTQVNTAQSRKSENPLLTQITPIQRNVLQEALSGDFGLMAQLIADWDVDAQLLEMAGHSDVKRLTRHSYLKSQVLVRQLLCSTPQRLRAVREQEKVSCVTDDLGNQIPVTKELSKLLPQTYVAASFLLALTSPEQIVALPNGLRKNTNLFPASLTSKVPLDLHHYDSEKLFVANPEIAFIAHYSHPALVDALRNQEISLFTMKNLNSIPEICDALKRIGHVINRAQEAELLSLFMEAAILAIDNHVWALQQTWKDLQSPRILFVSYHEQFSMPTAKTLTGQLLERMGIQLLGVPLDEQDKWSIPIAQEQIVNYDPHCLIVATPHHQKVQTQIIGDPALSHLSAIKHGRILFVDEAIQQFPSQYIVLAYYDLYNALVSANLL